MMLPIGLMLLILLGALGAVIWTLKRRFYDHVPPETELGPRYHENTADPDISNGPLIKSGGPPELYSVPPTTENLEHRSTWAK